MHTKVKHCIDIGLQERHFKETNRLQVCIGGLPIEWDKNTAPFDELVKYLNEALSPIQISKESKPRGINNKAQFFPKDQISRVYRSSNIIF